MQLAVDHKLINKLISILSTGNVNVFYYSSSPFLALFLLVIAKKAPFGTILQIFLGN